MGRLELQAGDHIIGSRDTATVQLVMYGDYECPYTRRGIALVAEMLDRIGDALLFVFRNFPLVDKHPHALHAALAAEAADRQGGFWDMHLALFRHQGSLDDDTLTALAGELGLDEVRFSRDFSSGKPKVMNDRTSGEALGTHSTPTFFVNGEKYDGSVDGITPLVEEAVTITNVPGES